MKTTVPIILGPDTLNRMSRLSLTELQRTLNRELVSLAKETDKAHGDELIDLKLVQGDLLAAISRLDTRINS